MATAVLAWLLRKLEMSVHNKFHASAISERERKKADESRSQKTSSSLIDDCMTKIISAMCRVNKGIKVIGDSYRDIKDISTCRCVFRSSQCISSA